MAPHRRTRTGCWTCREAGYKCDEQKPYCARCVRLSIGCKGYGVKLRWQDNNISTPHIRPRRATRKRLGEQDARFSLGSTDNFISTPATTSSSINITLSPKSTRSRSAALFTSPQPLVHLTTIDRWLLHYWVEQLSTLISIAPRKEHSTPFQLHLTAMIHDSSALRSTILSMAANHLVPTSSDPSLRTQAYRHQHNAIRELQSIIQDPTQAVTEPALATVLMMQISARLFGDDDASAANHLAGAKAMISRRSGANTSSTKFLLSLFAYHDILSSVSRGAQTLATHNASFTAVEGEVDMSSIASILLAVARISYLQHNIRIRRSTSPNGLSLTDYENATGLDIQQTLLSLHLIAHDSDIAHTAEAYRHAALIYLYRTWLGIGSPDPLTLQHVHLCLYYLALVPVTSPLTSSHTWPLFTAGCEAVSQEDRGFVRERFEGMYERCRFPGLRRVGRDVEDVWGAKDLQGMCGEGDRKGGAEGMKLDCIQVILRRKGREVDLA